MYINTESLKAKINAAKMVSIRDSQTANEIDQDVIRGEVLAYECVLLMIERLESNIKNINLTNLKTN